MKNKTYIFFIIATLTASCALLPQPDRFKLDAGSSAPIEGFILSDIDLVDVTADNELLLLDGGAASIKRPNITLSKAECVVNLRDGDGVRFLIRTDTKKYKTQPGIVFEWTRNGSAVFINGQKIATVDSVKAAINNPAKVIFLQDGDFFSITVNCDTVIKSRTKLPGSEFMIFESIKSKSLISAIYMDNLFEFEREVILKGEEGNIRTREEKVISPANNQK